MQNEMRVGNRGEVQHCSGLGRTAAQMQRVWEIVNGNEFEFSCGEPSWEEGVGKKSCTFAFTWYTHTDELVTSSITPTGRVTEVRAFGKHIEVNGKQVWYGKSWYQCPACGVC